MVGSPKNEGRKNPKYQLDRRRFTKVPGYTAFLPRIFPYRWRCAPAEAYVAMDAMKEADRFGYAISAHPSSTDGHIHLWLSADNAEYLVDLGYISLGSLEAT